MPLYVLVAALAVSVSIPILWWAVAAGKRDSRAVDVLTASADTANARRLVLEQGAGGRVLLPAVKSFGDVLMKLTPVGWLSSLRHRLTMAGYHGDSYALERVLVLKFILGALGFVTSIVFFSDLPGLQRLGVTVFFVALGFFIPDAVIARRGRNRQAQIQLEMPDTLDQLTMSVEAGLGFEAALARAAQTGDGPLAQEFNRTIREIQLGVSRDDALRQLADRTDVADLDSFVLAVVQSEKYGIGIGAVLRVQAEELRDKRRERAEERALKIPVLIIFPLAFCIFPAIFIVLLGPAGIRIYETLFSVF